MNKAKKVKTLEYKNIPYQVICIILQDYTVIPWCWNFHLVHPLPFKVRYRKPFCGSKCYQATNIQKPGFCWGGGINRQKDVKKSTFVIKTEKEYNSFLKKEFETTLLGCYGYFDWDITKKRFLFFQNFEAPSTIQNVFGETLDIERCMPLQTKTFRMSPLYSGSTVQFNTLPISIEKFTQLRQLRGCFKFTYDVIEPIKKLKNLKILEIDLDSDTFNLLLTGVYNLINEMVSELPKLKKLIVHDGVICYTNFDDDDNNNKMDPVEEIKKLFPKDLEFVHIEGSQASY